MSCLVPSMLVGDRSIIPAALAIGAATSAVALAVSLSRGVSITDEALVVGSIRGRVVLPWTAVHAMQRRNRQIWVGGDGCWYVLPLDADTPPLDGGAESGAPNLGVALWDTWLRQRGDETSETAPEPWVPSLDLRGRVVIRPPFESRVRAILGAAAIFCGQMIVPPPAISDAPPDLTIALQGKLAAFAFVTAVIVAHHLWSRVVIDANELVVRSLRNGITRIPRHTIVGLREEPGGRPTGQRLVLDQRWVLPAFGGVSYRVTRLPAPITASNWFVSDPAYYATWAWLQDELVTSAEPATPVIDDAVT